MQLTKDIKDRKDLFKSYYESLNGLLKLTKVELSLLIEFATQTAFNEVTPFSKESRKIAGKKLEMSSFSINNYIRSLKDKGVFVMKDDELQVNKALQIHNNKSKYEIHFIFNII